MKTINLKRIFVDMWEQKGFMMQETIPKNFNAVILDPAFMNEVIIEAMREACRQTVNLCGELVESRLMNESEIKAFVIDKESVSKIKDQIK